MQTPPLQRFRQATCDDYPQIANIYAQARDLMAANGNPHQWGKHYPSEAIIRDDIAHNRLILLVDTVDNEERILAQFAVCLGKDPTYAHIEGAWLDNDDYVTIHRIASSGLVPHAASACLTWALHHYGNVRLDTHPNNKTMQYVVEACGFARCGLIQENVHDLNDDTLDLTRIAYQRHEW